jgi:septum site-determining protein MinC
MHRMEESVPSTPRAVTIRGTNEGLIISLGSGPLHAALEEVEARLRAKASFFRGGRVALHTGDRALASEQLSSIGRLMEGLGMSLWAVESDHPTTCTAARELGLEVVVHDPLVARAEPAQGGGRDAMAGLVVRRTIRSGQAVHHAGHVIVIGDVNPGAEIVAGGDVVVWGRLRGTAHAGAMGDEEAVICALQLTPSQIRIGLFIARPPERGQPPEVPEMASVQDGQIVVERWNETG